MFNQILIITLHDAVLDEFVLGRCLKRYEVHATLPAEVPGGQPVYFLARCPLIVPRVVVTFAVEALVNRS